jgi:preprotein translocase subunit SecA
MGEATAYHEKREEELGSEPMREIERQVALRLIDQHWREHLHEMDYLQEGINLRAMGQKDPLVEWQREGFEMFGAMMRNIARDHVKYVMHVQVVVEEETASEGPAPEELTTSGPDDPSSTGSERVKAAARAEAAAEGIDAPPEVVDEPESAAPVVKSEWDKTPRNAPCPCGSGKKFKLCHGRS